MPHGTSAMLARKQASVERARTNSSVLSSLACFAHHFFPSACPRSVFLFFILLVYLPLCIIPGRYTFFGYLIWVLAYCITSTCIRKLACFQIALDWCIYQCLRWFYFNHWPLRFCHRYRYKLKLLKLQISNKIAALLTKRPIRESCANWRSKTQTKAW